MSDILVKPPIAEKIMDVVASTEKQFHVAPGGHMGVILGSKAQKTVWEKSVHWLAKRSQ